MNIMVDLNSSLASIGMTTPQAALIVAGAIASFLSPMMKLDKKYSEPLQTGGMLSLAAGGVWYLVNKISNYVSPTSSLASYGYPPGYYNSIQTRGYSNPVNNLDAIKPRNRFDLQSNYILNEGNSSFDNYINDIILNESKNLGLVQSNVYPVKVDPYSLATINPTTPTAPERDFNTVKMIA